MPLDEDALAHAEANAHVTDPPDEDDGVGLDPNTVGEGPDNASQETEDEDEDENQGDGSTDTGEGDTGEEDSDEEGDDDGDDDDDEPPARGEHFVPKSRLDRALARAREAEGRLQSKDGQDTQAQVEERDFSAELADLSDQFSKALLDGKQQEAATLNAKMMAVSQEQMRSELSVTSHQAAAATREAVVTDQMVDDLIDNNPVFQVESDEFDQDVVDDVEELRELYKIKGLTASEALAKAIKVRYPEATQRSSTQTSAPDVKTRGLKAKIDKASKAAPDLDGIGHDSPTHGRGRADQPPKTIADWFEVDDNDPRWDTWLGNNV